jgi:hypothetical protein
MIQRVVSAFLGVVLLAAIFLFTSFLIAVALTIGILAWAWLWWRSRGRAGRVIEGQYRVVTKIERIAKPEQPGRIIRP